MEQSGLVILSGNLKATKPGIYTFRYKVVDENGGFNVAEATTQVIDQYDFEVSKILYDTYEF